MNILTSDVLTQLIWSLPSLGLVAVAIVVIVAYSRYKKNELEKRSQIILTALEKGVGNVPEELLRSLNKPQKSLKERLLGKLLWGIICGLSGIGLVIAEFFMYDWDRKSFEDDGVLLVLGLVLLAVGIAFLIYYNVGKRELISETSRGLLGDSCLPSVVVTVSWRTILHRKHSLRLGWLRIDLPSVLNSLRGYLRLLTIPF